MNPTTFEPGALAEVDCRASGDGWMLVFVRDLRHRPEKVWAALIEPAQLREWAPYTADRDLSSIGEATLTMIDGDTVEDLPASVTRTEPPTLLEYTWGTDLLRWELAAIDSGTRLTLRHTIKDREWVPKVAAGWHLCLVVAEHLLDGQPVGPIRGRTRGTTDRRVARRVRREAGDSRYRMAWRPDAASIALAFVLNNPIVDSTDARSRTR